ncbi:polysaccharide pyruvyl transferase family protein [Clostridium sp. AL.422]|uniref:polysaccharide pyruvyl transferase family protein n=1 Tax=Clostridium TaxID=1485 RepID=UPI00293DC6B1|nr:MULTISPECIES: polysaccharide pyruvyl transferase family protein [unclassified Clostridium]MDV4150302.1 polysaccharide pyruvyl transferase family protein [Clostridium sp. AL.422]
MKILITGFFGKNNLGDDLMLEFFCKNISKSNDVTLLLIYGDEINFELPSYIKIKKLPKISKGKSLWIKYFYSINYDKIYWIGGTCFTENAGDGLYKYMKIFKKRKKSYGYIGVGIGDIKSEKKIQRTKELLQNAELVTFRDKTSYDYAKSICTNQNLFLCDDLVYLSLANLKKIKYKMKSLVISWRNLEKYIGSDKQEKAIGILIEFIKKISKDFDNIIIMPVGDSIDININKEIYNKLLEEKVDIGIEYLEDINNDMRIEVILSSELYICGRLHGIFLSEFNNVNTIAIGYDNKIEIYLKSINKMEDLIYPEDFSVDKLLEVYKVYNLIDNKLIEEGYKRAINNIELFKKFNKE